MPCSQKSPACAHCLPSFLTARVVRWNSVQSRNRPQLYQLSPATSARKPAEVYLLEVAFIEFVFHELTNAPPLTQVISRIATERYAFHRQQQWKQQATRLSPTPPGQRGHPSSAICLVTLPLRTPLSTTNLAQTTKTWQKQGQQQ